MNRLASAVLVLALAACSKPPAPAPEAPSGRGNADVARALQAEVNAPPHNNEVTAAPGGVERIEAFAMLKAPSISGNPHDFNVCATLFDKDGKPVAAEGEFTVTSELVSGTAYAYAPMFGPLSFPQNTSPLGFCPKGAILWPDAYKENRGKSFIIEVSFKDLAGKTVSVTTTFGY